MFNFKRNSRKLKKESLKQNHLRDWNQRTIDKPNTRRVFTEKTKGKLLKPFKRKMWKFSSRGIKAKKHEENQWNQGKKSNQEKQENLKTKEIQRSLLLEHALKCFKIISTFCSNLTQSWFTKWPKFLVPYANRKKISCNQKFVWKL